MKKSLYNEAIEAEKEGDLEEAATSYIGLSTYLAASSNYQPSRKLRESGAFLLLAISHDVVSGNNTRANSHIDYYSFIFDLIYEGESDQILQGIGKEWFGDALVMVGDDSAHSYYQDALDSFQDITLESQLYWSETPEYDIAYKAVKQYFNYICVDYISDHDIDFEKRVAWKMNKIREID